MDIVTYALAKKFAVQVAAGFSSVSVDEATSTINFTLNDGQTVSLTIPTPAEPAKIVNIQLKTITTTEGKIEQHIIFVMSDNSSFDAGVIPQVEIQISQKDGNILTEEDDGLYVPSTGVNLDDSESNLITNTDKGLYVPKLNTSEQQKEIVDIISKNIETENLDFSDF